MPHELNELCGTGDLLALHQFLHSLLEDHERGVLRPLKDYQRAFPGHEALIAAELRRLEGVSPSPVLEPHLEGRDETGEESQETLGRFGRYRLLSEIGRGGQAIVYRAEDPRLEREVAIKLLPATRADDAVCRLRIQREAEALCRFRHPGACTVHEVGEHGGVPFIAMQYVRGQSLEYQIQARRSEASVLDEAEQRRRVRMLEQIARALQAAHEAGVVHRDIKPANILITEDDEAVLVDFGIAHDANSQLSTLMSTSSLVGTAAYLPPERLSGARPNDDLRADIYALGATLYEALTQSPPFEGRSVEELYRKILTEDPSPPRHLDPKLPRDLEAVILTALAKDPDRRYQSAAALADDLARFLEGGDVRARPKTAWTRSVHWVRRNRALTALLAAVFSCLAIGLIVSLSLLRSASTTLEQNQRLRDLRSLPYLERIAEEELWPVGPETVPAMERWLEEAKRLAAKGSALHRSLLREMRPGRFAASSHDWPFRRGRRADETGHLEDFLEDLAVLERRIEEVQGRLALAQELEQRTIVDYRSQWRDVGEGTLRHPAYSGLHLPPQIGLVPLGQDPDSGLFEFAHLLSGEAPRRDPETDHLILTEDTAIVLVLVPGGRFAMGARRPDAEHPLGSPNVDPAAIGLWGPVHDVVLEPYFISKFEMTQGQYQRLTGGNPSRWHPGSDARDPITWRHPVENLSWEVCRRVLPRYGLRLPTEAQWEYAARAGSSSIWWTGDDRESLRGAVNLADASATRAGFDWPESRDWPGLDDGHVEHAPVGTYRPNGFGLYEVHGNVRELCLDGKGSYQLPVRRGDAVRAVAEPQEFIVRGGGFNDTAYWARSACRSSYPPKTSTFSTGVRPARAIRGASRGIERWTAHE